MSDEHDDERPPLTPDQVRAIVEHAVGETERRLHDAVKMIVSDLRSSVVTATLRGMATTASARKARSIGALSGGTKYRMVMAASKIESNEDLAEKLGVDRSLVSRYYSGKRPIPLSRAKKAQELTRSKQFPQGLEPTEEFWPGGIDRDA